MAYDGKVLRQATLRFDEDKQRRQEQQRQRQQQVYQQCPELEGIQREIRGTMGEIIASALRRGTDPLPAIRVIRDKNLSLQRRRAELLAQLGYPEDYLSEKPRCPLCGDTGYRGDGLCSCLKKYYAQEQIRELSRMLDIGSQSFDTFELDRYPAEPEPELGGTPRDYMGKVLAYCQRYANSFTPESRGLMFIGSAGLGKTHMALAIADTVLNRGFDVLYTSSAALAAQLGREHFDRAAEDPWLDACKEADLLILDDLGTEYISQLTISVLYELINTRMLCHRPTIYTSNIVDSSIFEARYTEKVASRILGSCQIFKFFGTDQRLKRGGKR